MKNNILVVGGYGQVGKIICKQLAETFPGKVMAAGRSYRKAEKFASSTGGKVIPLRLDINETESAHNILQTTRLAIMCLDQNNTRFVSACIANQVDYIDISPSYQTLTRFEPLSERAAENGVTILLGVGLLPGLSNLMVKHIATQYGRINSADIFLMLGVGEKHGKNGIAWLLNNLSKDFYITENNIKKRVKSFSDKKKTLFPDHLGQRTAYRFDLADQHIIPATLEIKNVSTRFCYDSRLITKEMAVLKKLGIFNLLKYPFMNRLFINLFEYILLFFSKLGIGSDVFSVKIDATATNSITETNYHASIIGNNNTKATGKVTALAAEKLYAKTYPSGVHYLEQLFELEEFTETLKSSLVFEFATT